MKKTIFVVFAVLVLFGTIYAQPNLIRYAANSGVTDLSNGRIVKMVGDGVIDYAGIGDKDLVGVIVGKEDDGAGPIQYYYLVATSGIVRVTLPIGAVAGTRLTVGAN